MKKNRIYFGLLILALVVTIVWTSAGMLGVNKEEKKYSVSVIVNDSNNDRWIAMREGLEQAAKDDDIQLNYVSTGVFASEDEEKALIEREVENGADGIIVQLVSSEDTYAVFEKIDSSVAVMLLETDAVSEGVYSVTAPDNLWIGEALAQTVLQDYGDSLSEKKIGILSGNQNQLSMQQRLGSVKKLLEDENIEPVWILSGQGENLSSELVTKQADEPVDITCNDSSITLVKKENDQWTVSLPNKTKTYLFTARYNGNANYAGSKAACQVTVKEKKSQTGGGTLIPPEKPTPEEPTPEKPAPEEPTPEKPAPEKPTPEKPAPEKPNPGETEVVPNVTPVPELESKTDKTIKNKTVTIKCKSRKGKKQVLKLDKSTINYLIKKEAKALQLEFGNVAVIMDRNALKEIKKQMNSDVYFHVKKLDKRILSSKAGKIVKKRPMYEISVTGAKKKTLGKLKKGKVTVKIHYKISKKEKKKDLFAYTINKKGNVKKISKSYYDSKKQTVNFTTKSFSKFAVGGRL